MILLLLASLDLVLEGLSLSLKIEKRNEDIHRFLEP